MKKNFSLNQALEAKDRASGTNATSKGILADEGKVSASRPSWENYFIDITRQVAKRSTCRRRRCGAILVKEKRILATGYNGVPSGLQHCLDRGCLREELGIPSGQRQELCRGLHAEQNALLQAALHGVKIDGATVYTTHQPCVLCAKMLINGGIKKIYYLDAYPDRLAEEILSEAKIECHRLGEKKSGKHEAGVNI